VWFTRFLIHGTPDAAFIYPLAQAANAQVPLAVGLSARHYSELSDAERVFLCRGLMPQGIAADRLVPLRLAADSQRLNFFGFQ